MPGNSKGCSVRARRLIIKEKGRSLNSQGTVLWHMSEVSQADLGMVASIR